MVEKIDIVILHKDRLDYLKRTLNSIWERTKSQYNICVIDQGSVDGSVEYLLELLKNKKINRLLLNDKNVGLYAGINQAFAISNTELFVFMADDTLVPDLEPDWLERLAIEFDGCDDLGILALHNPTTTHCYITGKTETITFSDLVNASVRMIRRKAYRLLPQTKVETTDETTTLRNHFPPEYRFGYLTDVYSKHIGEKSSFKNLYINDEFTKKTFVDVDPKTLKPLKQYEGD